MKNQTKCHAAITNTKKACHYSLEVDIVKSKTTRWISHCGDCEVANLSFHVCAYAPADISNWVSRLPRHLFKDFRGCRDLDRTRLPTPALPESTSGAEVYAFGQTVLFQVLCVKAKMRLVTAVSPVHCDCPGIGDCSQSRIVLCRTLQLPNASFRVVCTLASVE